MSSSAHHSFQSKLLHLDPRHNSDQRQYRGNYDSPKLYVQYILIEVGLRGGGYCGEEQQEDKVATHTMVLPDSLGVVQASVQARGVILCYANKCLDDEQYVGHKP